MRTNPSRCLCIGCYAASPRELNTLVRDWLPAQHIHLLNTLILKASSVPPNVAQQLKNKSPSRRNPLPLQALVWIFSSAIRVSPISDNSRPQTSHPSHIDTLISNKNKILIHYLENNVETSRSNQAPSEGPRGYNPHELVSLLEY